MHRAQLKASAAAKPWGSILALSVGVSLPSSLCWPAQVPTLSRSTHTARLQSIHRRSGGLAATIPTLVEGASWQQSLDHALWSRVRRLARLSALGGADAAAVDLVSKAQSPGDTAGNLPPEQTIVEDAAARSFDADRSSEESASRTRRNGSGEQLCFKAAAACIPHPAKVEKGGEDASFISDDGLALGVADGVGSWSEIDIDAGIYSRMLMGNAKRAAESTPPSHDAPLSVLKKAYHATDAKGSCTACIVMLDGSTLRASNLGDSGFLVLRNSQIVFQSPTQQHQFNFPYQLGGPDSRGDPPDAADRFDVGLQKGDIVVLATDGVIDNVFPQETAALTSVIQRRGDPPQMAAAGLAEFAKMRAGDSTHLSPFAYGAQRAGYQYMGGKMDDITVVVAYVSSASAL